MKTMNKVIAAMMMMAITMPAMAGNKKHTNHDKKTTVVVVNNDKNRTSIRWTRLCRTTMLTKATSIVQKLRPAPSG